MVLLSVRDLVMEYDGKHVLNGINLELEAGELKVVMGPSGCGKSTLLRCLNRLLTPNAGQILFDGEDVTRPTTDVRALRQRIGFVFQNFALYRHLTALGNVTLGLRKLRGMRQSEAVAKAEYELQRMDMLAHKDKYPAQLSGGQKQRVAIARALAMDPTILFFDEPTSALDPVMSREVIAVINQLQRDQISMLCVTHDLMLAQGLAAPVLFLDQGRIHVEASYRQLADGHHDPVVRAFFSHEAKHA